MDTTALAPYPTSADGHLAGDINQRDSIKGPTARSWQDDAATVDFGIWVTGRRIPRTTGSYASVRDIRIQRVAVIGAKWNCIKVSGVEGSVTVTDSSFTRGRGPSFEFDEMVEFVGNTVSWSAADGVRFGRANVQVLCTSNMITGSYVAGVSLEGGAQAKAEDGVVWTAGPGSTNATIAANVITASGRVGVSANGGAKRVSIAGNTITDVFTIDQALTTPTSVTTDTAAGDLVGVGVLVGFNYSSPAAERSARDITITGNVVTGCALGGVLLRRGSQNVLVAANHIAVAGVPATAPDVTYDRRNYGVAVIGSTNNDATDVTGIVIRENTILGAGVQHPVWINPKSTGCRVSGNTAFDTQLPVTQTLSVPAGKTRPTTPQPGTLFLQDAQSGQPAKLLVAIDATTWKSVTLVDA